MKSVILYVYVIKPITLYMPISESLRQELSQRTPLNVCRPVTQTFKQRCNCGSGLIQAFSVVSEPPGTVSRFGSLYSKNKFSKISKQKFFFIYLRSRSRSQIWALMKVGSRSGKNPLKRRLEFV
jgi:hypothetical protein